MINGCSSSVAVFVHVDCQRSTAHRRLAFCANLYDKHEMKLIWTETVRQFNVSFHALLECLQISLQLAYAIHSVCRVNLSGFTCHRVQASRFLCTICSYVTTRQKFVTVLSLVMLQAKVYSDPFCARQHICQARYVLSQFCTSV